MGGLIATNMFRERGEKRQPVAGHVDDYKEAKKDDKEKKRAHLFLVVSLKQVAQAFAPIVYNLMNGSVLKVGLSGLSQPKINPRQYDQHTSV